MRLTLDGALSVKQVCRFAFGPNPFSGIEISPSLQRKIAFSSQKLSSLIEQGIPIYGVTTGFGDRSGHCVDRQQTEELQRNLIRYLSCGQGDVIPLVAARAMFLIRLNSLSQGYSGVSFDLIQHMKVLLEEDIIPVVPCEGSLGASGDLVPLAYLAQVVQGEGQAFFQGQRQETRKVFERLGLSPYTLKAKEGLAIVNGTSTMAGMVLYNLKISEFLIALAEVCTAWQCLVLRGRTEAFGAFINGIAKTNPGQKQTAARLRQLLAEEDYRVDRGQTVTTTNGKTDQSIQDPYSLRCAPQILGPARESLSHAWENLQHEINSITDNPVIDDEGRLEMGGNFYGGYLCQSMDFIKINLAHLTDLADRQVLMLVSESTNRDLGANLVDVERLEPREINLHHGLKGVHQAVSAVTSEIMPKAIPSGIFSRSSESHNQDKVSLGMSAAMSCHEIIEKLLRIYAMQLTCLAQALDLRKIRLKGSESLELYELVRSAVPFVSRDRALGMELGLLANHLKEKACRTLVD